MASDHRIDVGLRCTESGHINYVSTRNRNNTKEKLEIKKYNPHLRKHTIHKEVKIQTHQKN